jgi:Tfp pilus assembly protein PilF/heme exporter protein D
MKKRRIWSGWLALLIALAAFLPYLGTLQADFVWDDDLLVVDHAYYRDPTLFWSTFTRNLIFSPNYFRPAGLLTLFADFQLHGFQPWGYHLTNALLHAATSALTYLLLRRLLRGLQPEPSRRPQPEPSRRPGWLPFGLALIFAWHPIHVETVSFVADRFDLLCALFYLLTLLLGLAALRPFGQAQGRPFDKAQGRPFERAQDKPGSGQAYEAKSPGWRAALAAGTGLSFLLALAAKEMAVTLPLALAACYTYHTSRFTSHVSRLTSHVSHFTFYATRTWPIILSLGLSTTAYLVLRTWGLGYLYLSQPDAGLPVGNPLQHALLVGRSATGYLRLLALPWGGLSPIHYANLPLPVNDPLAWLALGLTVGLLAALALATFRASRFTFHGPRNTFHVSRPTQHASPQGTAAWLWLAFAITLLPVVNLLPLELSGGAFISERFAYLPAFFFLAAVGASGQTLRVSETLRVSWRRAAAGLTAALALVGLAGVLVTVPHWRDDVALWTWASQRAPRSDLPWVNLAVQAGNRGQAEQALEYANRALTHNPSNASAHDTAGLALFRLGDYAGAERAFRNGLALEPEDAHLWSNLAGAMREQGRLEEASHVLIDQALARDPTLWTAHLGLGLCHLTAGRPDLALEPFRQAVYYQSQASETWARLIGALVATGQGAETIEVMTRSPFASPEAWLHLGNDLLASGQTPAALQAYDRALTGADPAAVHLQRSLAFMQLGDLERAEAALRVGLTLAPDDGRLHNNLGMILREQENPDGALAAFETAWRLLPDSALVARNLAQTHQTLGHANEASQWQALADQLRK